MLGWEILQNILNHYIKTPMGKLLFDERDSAFAIHLEKIIFSFSIRDLKSIFYILSFQVKISSVVYKNTKTSDFRYY